MSIIQITHQFARSSFNEKFTQSNFILKKKNERKHTHTAHRNPRHNFHNAKSKSYHYIIYDYYDDYRFRLLQSIHRLTDMCANLLITETIVLSLFFFILLLLFSSSFNIFQSCSFSFFLSFIPFFHFQ